MNMSAFQNLLMGFISGFAEMLPISAEAHRLILLRLFGMETEDALLRLLLHLSCLLTVLWLFQADLRHLRRTSRLMKIPEKRRRQRLDLVGSYTVRLLRLAVISMLICRLLFWKLRFIQSRPAYMTLTLTINGILLLIPRLLRTGDMDSRNMPKLAGIAMGVGCGLGGVPGISPVGATVSFGISSGVDRHYALRFSYILLVPSLLTELVFDLKDLIQGGMAAFSGRGLTFALLGACFAALGANLGVRLMRSMADRHGYDGFAYYCWGAALMSFILFLIV